MTQEQLKEQAESCMFNNLNDDTKKELVISLLNNLDTSYNYEVLSEMLDNFINTLFIDGFIKESNEIYLFKNKLEDWNK